MTLRPLVSIWPWDENAMAQVISLTLYWQERPTMAFLMWIDPLRQLAEELPP